MGSPRRELLRVLACQFVRVRPGHTQIYISYIVEASGACTGSVSVAVSLVDVEWKKTPHFVNTGIVVLLK